MPSIRNKAATHQGANFSIKLKKKKVATSPTIKSSEPGKLVPWWVAKKKGDESKGT